MESQSIPERRHAELDRLYRRYGGLVLRRARRLLANEQAAHDVCQDVFVQLLRTSSSVEAASEVAWLYRITTNCCLNLIRRANLWRKIERVLPTPTHAAPSQSTELLLRGIPERLHEVAIYYGLDRMTQEEVSLVLGLSQKTVSNRVRELRALLSDDGSPRRQESR
jgi:RNA polymerase sigma factor (sigma-70 family)